jgi:hypothetical protein
MWRYLKYIAAAAVLLVFAAATPGAVKLAYLLSTPLECGEEMGTTIGNTRGDVAAENLRVCFGLGAFVDYSITLHTRESEKVMKLVEYDPSSDATAPVTLRWIDNDTLTVDLGNVRSVWSKVDKVGSIHVTYSYNKADTSWWQDFWLPAR